MSAHRQSRPPMRGAPATWWPAPRCGLTWTLLALFWLAGASAQTPERGSPPAPAQRLEGLQHELGSERERLETARAERQHLERILAASERDAAVVLRRLRQLEGALGRKSEALDALRARRADRAVAIDRLRAGLAEQVRASYQIGRNDHLKLLLNQQDPERLSRALAYHGYVARARAGRIEGLLAELTRLEHLEQAIAVEAEELRSLTASAAAAREEHGLQRERRQAALDALTERIASAEQRVARLRRDSAELERVLAVVKPAARRPAPPATAPRRAPPSRSEDGVEALSGEQRAFAELRGALPWPTVGNLAEPFGEPGGDGDLRRSGVRLAAPSGQPVNAVAAGQVVFADWLRGFGLLLILDHGEGYMSLYGHVREALKETGDWVSGGETIGTVGDSGGQSEAGLYFEIRHQGQPVDPARWCAGEPGSRSVALVR